MAQLCLTDKEGKRRCMDFVFLPWPLWGGLRIPPIPSPPFEQGLRPNPWINGLRLNPLTLSAAVLTLTDYAERSVLSEKLSVVVQEFTKSILPQGVSLDSTRRSIAALGNFVGTWVDERGFHAAITGDGGAIVVRYIDVARGPFQGHEFNPDFAPANIVVRFSDVDPAHQEVQGFLQDGGQKIVWSNDTTWTMVSNATQS